MSTLTLELKMHVLKYDEVSPDHKNLFGLTIRVNTSILTKMSTLSPYPVIAYCKVFWYQELSNEHENWSGSTI